jgi:hypothetical protein
VVRLQIEVDEYIAWEVDEMRNVRCKFEHGHSAALTDLQVAGTITTITVFHWLAHTHRRNSGYQRGY